MALDALPDVDAARRCDPSALADIGALSDAPLPDGPYVVELSLDISHACALKSDGTVHCRGANDRGELGDGTAEHRFERAVPVAGLVGAAQVVVGLDSTCARMNDGTVRCWGSNIYHQLGVGHAGDEDCGGTPCRLRPAPVPGLTDIVHLASSRFTYCAARRDGSVWCWGTIGFPAAIPTRPAPTPVRMPGLDDVVWLRALRSAWLARHRDGRYEALVWGADPPTFPREAEIPEGIRNDHVCYLLPDASMRCLGYNHGGKIGNGTSSYPEDVAEPWDPGLCGVRSIVTGGVHTCAVLADRRVWCWGDIHFDSVGDADPATERCVGVNRPVRCATRPTRVEGVDQVERLFAGTWQTCAIRTDRSVWCWGGLFHSPATSPARVAW